MIHLLPLQKSARNPEEAELEDLLSQVMTVFKYIEDKDVFQKFYTKRFAQRLVGGELMRRLGSVWQGVID